MIYKYSPAVLLLIGGCAVICFDPIEAQYSFETLTLGTRSSFGDTRQVIVNENNYASQLHPYTQQPASTQTQALRQPKLQIPLQSQPPKTAIQVQALTPVDLTQIHGTQQEMVSQPIIHVKTINNPSASGMQSCVDVGPTRAPPSASFMEKFSSELFQKISRYSPQQNIVFSPSSVHALLGLLYLGSSGETENELRQAGHFSSDKQSMIDEFDQLMKYQENSPNAKLVLASQLFYNEKLGNINPDYQNVAFNHFKTTITNFNRLTNPQNKINAWVSDNTFGKIKEVITANDIDDRTDAILINAIYFKARWSKEFSEMDTIVEPFKLISNQPLYVSMMYNDDVFPYADLPDINAKALELTYSGTEINMLFILPNENEGLAQLEHNLTKYNLNVIASRLRMETVVVRIPKFHIEFEQDMVAPLQELNVKQMFTAYSQVNGIFPNPVRVSIIKQKVLIDVNEAGSEAAAATYAKFVPLSLPIKMREFTADHPFVFAIRTPKSVLFVGHVVQPTQAPHHHQSQPHNNR